MSKHVSLRIDESLRARVKAIAKQYGMEFSAAARLLLKRGCSAVEADDGGGHVSLPRRKVLSKGVG